MSTATIVTGSYKAARSLAGVSVTYTRSGTTLTLTALAGRSVFELDRVDEIVHSSESRDYFFLTSELTLDPPQRGDRIVETVNGSTHTYEVYSPAGLRHYRYADPNETVVRVHTKRVANA